MQRSTSRRSLIVGLLFTVLIWTLAFGAWFQWTAISDWWRLRGYEPAQEIVALADATAMSDYARHVFYVHHPRLEPASSFNDYCRNGNEFTIVLGCYVGGQGIYIFRIDDKRLDGIEEVTAAHELLHATYDRLSNDERMQVNRLTASFFDTRASERLQRTISEYRADDPESVPGELYAIIGSEVRNIPSELERHYARFFTDRSKVVGFAEDYEQAFSDRKVKIDRLEVKLTDLKEEIDSRRDLLEIESAALSREYDRINRIVNTADPQSYRAAAEAYNSRVRQYNTAAEELSALIDSYNDTYEAYESLVLEQQDLFDAIDSRPEAINTR